MTSHSRASSAVHGDSGGGGHGNGSGAASPTEPEAADDVISLEAYRRRRS